MNPPICQLDDDVLLLILSYLHGEDALNAALSSKRLHGLASPRIASQAYCWEPRMVSRMCDYMLLPIAAWPRARHLQVLGLMPTSLLQGDHTEFTSLASSLGDLLAEAHGLRVLRWTTRFQTYFFRDPRRISFAFRRWGSLSVLELSEVDSEIVSLLQHITPLRVLVLRHNILEWGQGNDILPSLLTALSKLRALHTLSLGYIHSGTEEGSMPVFRGTFPSIVNLSLHHCSAHFLLLVPLCSGLSRLEVRSSIGAIPGPSRVMCWPSLAYLAISPFQLDPLLELHRLSTVRKLHLYPLPSEAATSGTPEVLRRALPVLSPVSVSFSTTFRRVQTNPLLDVLACSEPGVHMLDIDVNPRAHQQWAHSWQDIFANALARNRLVSLRLIVHTYSSWRVRLREHQDSTQTQAHLRKDTLSTLQRKLFEMLPTLRVLAVAEEDRLATSQRPADAAGSAPKSRYWYMNGEIEEGTDHVEEGWTDWDTLDRRRFQFHWWCRVAAGAEPMRVTEREGDLAYQGVFDAFVDGMSGESDPTAEIERLVASMFLG